MSQFQRGEVIRKSSLILSERASPDAFGGKND